MLSRLQALAIPLLLLLAAVMAVAIDYQKASVPMIRNAPQAPLYVLGSPAKRQSVMAGNRHLVMGPWCYGLFTGAQAFSSVSEATEFVDLKGLARDRWQIYQTSGDYRLDVIDGVLNKTLLLQAPLPYSHP